MTSQGYAMKRLSRFLKTTIHICLYFKLFCSINILTPDCIYTRWRLQTGGRKLVNMYILVRERLTFLIRFNFAYVLRHFQKCTVYAVWLSFGTLLERFE